MTLATITTLPTAANTPVINPKTPGRRPKAIPLIWRARLDRYRRENADQRPPNPVRRVAPPPVKAGKFNYPKSMLKQAYFCKGGDGTWYLPGLHLRMLVHEDFVSPIGALLDQLEREGHDIGGARGEWLAFRELAKGLESQIKTLERLALEMENHRPVLTQAFLQNGKDGL